AIKHVDVPKASFMSHVKANLKGAVKKNAWYAAWFASMAAAGWAIDELTGQVTKPLVKVDYYGASTGFSTMDYRYIGDRSLKASVASAINECTSQRYLECSSDGKLTFYSAPNYYSYKVTYKVSSGGSTTHRSIIFRVESTTSTNEGSEAVPDDAIYQSLSAEMMKDPVAAAQAFMVPDAWPYPYPHIFPDPVKYIPGVSEADEALLDSLIKGQLQTTNPNAPNYVTPEKLQQLQQLLSQLQQGITPEGGVGSANDKLKDPLTQAQLEETIKKEKAAEEKAIKDALGEKPSFDKLAEPLDKFVENVNKTPQDEINPLPQNTFGIAGSGTCYLIQKPISIMGVTVDMSTRSFCEAYYYPYFLPILTWFFYIATGLYIWFSLRDAYSRRI
ncbi:TPA: hypothetical protein ACSP0N_004191, partial [Aeromonas veronii]